MKQMLENLNDILIGWGRAIGVLRYDRRKYAMERYMQCLDCWYSKSFLGIKFCGICRCACIAKACTDGAAYKCPVHIWKPFWILPRNTKTRRRAKLVSTLVSVHDINDEKTLVKNLRDAGFVGPDNKVVARHVVEFFK